MDRAEARSIGISVVGHALLLAALTFGLMQRSLPSLPLNEPVEVSLADGLSPRT